MKSKCHYKNEQWDFTWDDSDDDELENNILEIVKKYKTKQKTIRQIEHV